MHFESYFYYYFIMILALFEGTYMHFVRLNSNRFGLETFGKLP